MRINASRLQWSITHDEMTVILVVRTYKADLLNYIHASNWESNYESEVRYIVYNHTFTTYCSFYCGRPKYIDPSHLILEFRKWWSKYSSSTEYFEHGTEYDEHLSFHFHALPDRDIWECRTGDGYEHPCRLRPLYSIAQYTTWAQNAPKIGIFVDVNKHTVSNRRRSRKCVRIDALEVLR